MIRYAFLFLALFVAQIAVFGQVNVDDIALIKRLLVIEYVGSPNDTTSVPVVINNEEVSRKRESGAFWSTAGIQESKNLVRQILRADNRSLLQYYIADILRIQNKKITFRIINDEGSLMPVAEKFCLCITDRKAWPCAQNFLKENPNSPIGGLFTVGTQYMRIQNKEWAYATILHELAHTQDMSSTRWYLFHHGSYGWDNTHYLSEIVPDYNASYVEGLANFFAISYSQKTKTDFLNMLTLHSEFVVEKSGAFPAETFIDDLKALKIAPIRSDTSYNTYRVQDIPPYIKIYNEVHIAVILSMIEHHFGRKHFRTVFESVNRDLSAVCASNITVLIASLCRAGLPDEFALPEDLQVSYNGPKYHLLPLAFADYTLTGFSQAMTKEDFYKVFESQEYIRPFIELYWNERSLLTAAVSHQKFDDASYQKITELLGIQESRE